MLILNNGVAMLTKVDLFGLRIYKYEHEDTLRAFIEVIDPSVAFTQGIVTQTNIQDNGHDVQLITIFYLQDQILYQFVSKQVNKDELKYAYSKTVVSPRLTYYNKNMTKAETDAKREDCVKQLWDKFNNPTQNDHFLDESKRRLLLDTLIEAYNYTYVGSVSRWLLDHTAWHMETKAALEVAHKKEAQIQAELEQIKKAMSKALAKKKKLRAKVKELKLGDFQQLLTAPNDLNFPVEIIIANLESMDPCGFVDIPS